jgi:superfamily II DNA or RNA helicase
MDAKKIPKKAICIRKTSSWSHLIGKYKFDTNAFDKNDLNVKLSQYSPKMEALINKIKELDERDFKRDGTLYKHIIYSDVSGSYGAKMVASVLLANGLNMVYDKKFNIKPIKELKKSKYSNFALLTSSTVYKRPLSVGLKKKILALLNERPDNIYGENVRFVILDQTFKEGIDVFDVKYLHILEPLLTAAEQTQVIGRGTRFCGQMGLPFNPKYGWKLEVFRYNMTYENTDVFKLYLKHANIDLSAINFSAELEDILKASAVDSVLTENIHNYNNSSQNRFKNLISKLESLKKSTKKDKILVNVYGKIYNNDVKINCNENCHGALQKAPAGILLIAALYSDPKLWYAFTEKYPKTILCNMLSKNKEFCKTVNQLWLQPIRFLKIYGKDLRIQLDKLYARQRIIKNNYDEMVQFMDRYTEHDSLIKGKIMPPPTRLNYIDMKRYIKKYYNKFLWPAINITNLCIKQKSALEDSTKGSKVTFTLSQDFVRNYFVPQSPYKGLFLYHSVGTGKTCTAIATASSSFEKEGYTIIWVTRHTLKEDIWKNMFDKICNVIIQEKKDKGLRIPKTRAERMKILGKNWFPILSYKQFTNMIKGRNKYYQQLVRINGTEDPFRKTLIIIDEIHKVYSSSLSALEKPNPAALNEMVQKSFSVSGVNSIRLLLMTATPITEDPLSAIKILNLILPKDEQFTENYNEFIKEYCNEEGIFTEQGAYNFINKVSGYISHLDRSSDIRQFAYPIIKDILVKPDDSANLQILDRIKYIEDEITKLDLNKPPDVVSKNAAKQDKVDHKIKVKIYKDAIKAYNKELRELTKKLDKDDTSATAMIKKCIDAKQGIKSISSVIAASLSKSSNKSSKPNIKSNKKRLPKLPKKRPEAVPQTASQLTNQPSTPPRPAPAPRPQPQQQPQPVPQQNPITPPKPATISNEPVMPNMSNNLANSEQPQKLPDTF